MINRRLDDMLRQLDMQLRYQGMNLEGYLQMTGMEMDEIRADYRESALEESRPNWFLKRLQK